MVMVPTASLYREGEVCVWRVECGWWSGWSVEKEDLKNKKSSCRGGRGAEESIVLVVRSPPTFLVRVLHAPMNFVLDRDEGGIGEGEGTLWIGVERPKPDAE